MTAVGTARSIAVMMTCHNRCNVTIKCLRSLAEQRGDGIQLSLFVTDDASSDGTAEAIRAEWPDATILRGSGHLFWAAGMALAEEPAVASGPDYLLWLNDDTLLRAGALQLMLDVSENTPGAIVVGVTSDPLTGEQTYGGRVRLDYHPQRFRLLPVANHPQLADTFHGNVVLIPIAVRHRVGGIDGAFPHAYADDDYGLRATSLGVPIVQAPGFVATCPANERPLGLSGGPASRWRQLQSPTALPWRAQARYLRRHGDWRWPALLVAGQLRRVLGWGR